ALVSRNFHKWRSLARFRPATRGWILDRCSWPLTWRERPLKASLNFGNGVLMSWDEEGNPWTLHGVHARYDNPWMVLEDHDVTHPGGKRSMYGVVRMRKIAVGVLPIEPDGRVHLVGQWRFPLGRYSWEMPEGGAEPGEAPEECARRELSEEA